MKRFILILLFLALGYAVVDAQIRVTGTVTSAEDNQPLPGVSVLVKGTQVGTITNASGFYSLEVANREAVLEFSFVGMEDYQVTVGDQTSINVSLSPASLDLDEVVVTAIGISRKQKALGYSVVDVSADATIQKSEPDLLKSLQGKIPGVEIRSSGGSPGSATRITIRGNSSFTGNNEPLFVVDGIPYSNTMVATTDMNLGGGAYGNSLSTLDPNDIESMSVLKGAAAASLYGSRAMNGVVVITTKSGNASASKKGLEVTVSSSVNFETIAKLPEYQNTYGNGANFNYQNANGSWGPRFDMLDSIPIWSQDYVDLGWPETIPYEAQPDNVANLFKTGVVYDNSLNIQGGNDRSAVSLTASTLNNNGYIPFSSFDRYSISTGGSTKLDNGLRVNGSVSYTKSTQVGGIFGNNQADSPEAASSFARALWLGRTWIMEPYTRLDGGPLQQNGQQYDNPLWSWEHNQVTTNMDRVNANIGLSYDLTSWLTASYKIGVNTFIQSRMQVVDIGSRGYEGLGGIVQDNYRSDELESNFILTSNFDITDKLSVTALVGHNLNQRTTDRQAYQGKIMIVPGIYDIDNTQNVIPYGGVYTNRRLIGVFGDVTVDYDNYLFFNLTGRNDWSSTLPLTNNNYFYPAASLSLLLTEAIESLKSNLFNYGKLRVSWGKVGNDALPYSIYDTYGLNNPFLDQPSMFTPNTGYDPNLSPEFKTEFEVGTNLVFFNNRVNFDFTYYNNNSTDLITTIDVSPSTGYTQQYTNVGQLNNKGVEIALGLIPVQTQSGFTWNMNFTFTKNISEVISISEGVDMATIGALFGDPQVVIAVGQPYGVFYGEKDAMDDEGNLLIDQGTGLLIRDTEPDFIGDPNPDFITSMNNSLQFRGIFLSFLIDYKHGGDVYSTSIASLLGRGVTKDTEDREKNFIIPGYYGDPNTGEPLLDSEGNKIPNVTQVSCNDLYFGESFAINSAGYYNVFDATVVRLREISVGFELPKKMLSKLPFGNVSFSVTGRNLWYFAPNIPTHTHFDPDVHGYGSSNVQGVEYSVATNVKRIGFNLKVTF